MNDVFHEEWSMKNSRPNDNGASSIWQFDNFQEHLFRTIQQIWIHGVTLQSDQVAISGSAGDKVAISGSPEHLSF